jgi:hypothetical protein
MAKNDRQAFPKELLDQLLAGQSIVSPDHPFVWSLLVGRTLIAR